MTEPPPSHREGIPEFVATYDRIRALIAERELPPGALLPGEVPLSADLGVTRPVLQEALLLLEEDGYVARDTRRRRTVGSPGRASVGFADSFHRMLGPDVAPVRRLHAATESTSSFSRDLLDGAESCLVWETVFGRGDQLLAATLEFLRLDALPADLAPQSDPRRHDVAAQPTLLEALGPERRARLTPRLWRIAPTSRSTERLGWMDLALHAIPAVLTVVLAEDGVPIYLAKNLFDLDSFNLTVDLTEDVR